MLMLNVFKSMAALSVSVEEDTVEMGSPATVLVSYIYINTVLPLFYIICM